MNKDDIELVFEYRKTQLPELEKRATSLNGIAARIIVDGLLAYGWSLSELLTSRSSLIEQVKKHIDITKLADKMRSQYSITKCSKTNIDSTDASSKKRPSGHVVVDDAKRKRASYHSSKCQTSTSFSERTGATDLLLGETTDQDWTRFLGSSGELLNVGLHSNGNTADQDWMQLLGSSGKLPDFGLRSNGNTADQDWTRFLGSSGELPDFGLRSNGNTADQDWMQLLGSSGELPDFGLRSSGNTACQDLVQLLGSPGKLPEFGLRSSQGATTPNVLIEDSTRSASCSCPIVCPEPGTI
jgi:hypothetical protein